MALKNKLWFNFGKGFLFLTLACFSSTLKVISQNLVNNCSFETNTGCPTAFGQITLSTTWSNIAVSSGPQGTCDYYHTCGIAGLTGIPSNLTGTESARTGSAYAGLIFRSTTSQNYREYLQNTLISPLVAGATYYVEFWVSLGDNMNLAVANNNLGLKFSVNPIVGGANNNVPVPQVIPNIVATGTISNKVGWTKISGCFTALGGESFITIGNFYNDANTPLINAGPGNWPHAVYFIEDVSVVNIATISITASPQNICSGSSTLTAIGPLLCDGSSALSSFSWSPSSSLNANTGPTVIATPSVSTIYTLSTSNCFQVTTTVAVNVGGNFTVNTSVINPSCSATNGSLIISNVIGSNGPFVLSSGSTTLATNITPPYTYTNASVGTNTYILTSANGCSTTFTVQILPGGSPPNLSVVSPVTLNCLPSTTLVTASSTSTTSPLIFSWSGPSVISASNIASATVNQPGNYTVIIAQGSCTNSAVVSVVGNTNTPTIFINIPAILNCTNGSVVLTGTSTTNSVTYLWSPQNVTTNTALATASGNYTLTVTNPINGCTSSSVVTVNQNTLIPTISAAASNTIKCNIPNATLTATSAGNSIVWNGGSLTNAANPAVVSSSGSYTATATNTLSGCTTSTVISVVQNTTLMPITFTAPVISCSPTTSQLLIININNNTNINTTYTLSNPTYTYTSNGPAAVVAQSLGNFPSGPGSPGIYTISAVNPANGCITTQTILVGSNTATPNLSITTPSVLTCVNTSVVLTGTSTTSGASYSWSPQNVLTNTAIATAPGNYTFTVTHPTSACKTTSVITVIANTVSPNVSATVSNSLTCQILTATLTGSSTTSGATFSWLPQNVSTNTTIATAIGSYTLIVTNPVNGCSAATIVQVGQSPGSPTISAVISNTITCINSNATLTAASSGNSIVWNGGSLTNAANPAIVNASGSYTATATNTLSGCTTSTVITVSQNTIVPTLNAFLSNTLNCTFTVSTLTATGSGNVFTWNGANLTNASNPVLVTTGGSYTATATNTLNGCSSSFVITVQQNTTQPNLTVSSSNNLGCQMPTANLVGSSSTPNATFIWLPQNVNSQSITVSSPASYSLVVLDPANSCTNMAVLTVTAIPMFTANISILSQINCFGQNNGALSINNLGGGTLPFTITNLNNNNTVSNITTFPVNLNNLSAGNYSIQITDANGCKQTLFSNINQPAQLALGISGNTVMCAGQSANITSNVNGGAPPYNFLWLPTGGNAQTLNASPTANTNFTVNVTDNNGCQALASIAIVVNPKPSASLVNGKLTGCAPVCAGFSLSQSQNSGYTYAWSFASALTSTVIETNVFNPVICFTQEGNYTANISIATPQGCSTTISYNNLITVYAKPIAEFSFTPDAPHVIDYPEVSFTNYSADANSFEWYNVNTLFSYEKDPNHIFTDPGKYLVTLIASNTNCSDTISRYITIEDDFFLYIPNSFTPNDDGKNDFFYPVLTGDYSPRNYSFEIFDRWGALLYRSNNPLETQWNGLYKNEVCKDDIYVWKINLTDARGKTVQKTGHVTLMK